MATKPLSKAAMAKGADNVLTTAVMDAQGIKHGTAVDMINAVALNGASDPITITDVLKHAKGISDESQHPIGQDTGSDQNGYAVEGGSTPVGGDPDPFSLDNLSVAGTNPEDLGIEKPLLHIPVDKPGRQDFFRVHPDTAFRLDARIIKLDAERETYLVTRPIWPEIPGETKLVRLVPALTRLGTLYLWPLPMPDDLMGKRDTAWGSTARKAAEVAEKTWVRMQANMASGSYDIVTSSKIPDPVWPGASFSEMLRIAFGDGRLIDRMDHPVLRQLGGQ